MNFTPEQIEARVFPRVRTYPIGTCDVCCEPNQFLESIEDNAICTDCFDYSNDLAADYAELEADAARKVATQNLSAQVQSYALGFLTAVALGAFLLLPWLSEGK